MKYFLTLFILLSGFFNYAQTFDDMNAGLPKLFNSLTAFGDADGDGDLDLFLSGTKIDNTLAGGLYVYNGGTYTLSTNSGLPLLTLGSASWGDVNNDGHLDFLILGYNDNTGVGLTDVYLNNNDGTFSALNLGLPPSFIGEASFSDINSDSYIDIAITGMETVTWSYITKVYKNNGNSTFSEISGLNLPGMNFGRIKFADYDNDGYQDFALSGLNGSTDAFYTRIFNNNTNETFTESGISLHESWLGDIEWGDYNADGNIDLIVSGTGGSTGDERLTLLYKNNGNGTFVDINANLPGVSHSSLEWADFDNDGDLDILIIGTLTTPGDGNYIHNIYNNNGDGTFSASITAVLSGSYYGDADSGDIDGDGKIDVVISGYDESDIPASNVFINTTMVVCNPPENLTAFLDEETYDVIYLNWDAPPSNNDKNRELLGYNIYREGSLIQESLTETTYSDTEGLLPGALYCYTVTAVYSDCGESGPSNEACTIVFVGLKELTEIEVVLYPNPSDNHLNIKSVQEINSVIITNGIGQVIYRTVLNSVTEVELNTTSYNEGIYFVKIETEGGVIIKQIVVSR